jgi:hypothetical protein
MTDILAGTGAWQFSTLGWMFMWRLMGVVETPIFSRGGVYSDLKSLRNFIFCNM